MKAALSSLALSAAMLVLPARAFAHGADAAGIAVTERADGNVQLRIDEPEKTAGTVRVVLPAGCHAGKASPMNIGSQRVASETVARCDAPLAGRALEVVGLPAGSDALVRVESADGSVFRTVARSTSPQVDIPLAPTRGGVVLRYGALGVHHLFAGLDHLLFVVGLVLLARRLKAVTLAVTSFTIGHSITLIAAALGWLVVPTAWAELAIAASLVLLGVRIVTQDPDTPAPNVSRLGALAGAMGLLHGLGFAAALRDAGLPEGEIPLALAAFNVGIEVAQIALVLGLFAVFFVVQKARYQPRDRHRAVAGYALGALAAMWCLERAQALVG